MACSFSEKHNRKTAFTKVGGGPWWWKSFYLCGTMTWDNSETIYTRRKYSKAFRLWTSDPTEQKDWVFSIRAKKAVLQKKALD